MRPTDPSYRALTAHLTEARRRQGPIAPEDEARVSDEIEHEAQARVAHLTATLGPSAMSEREAQLLLADGWVRRAGDGWELYDATTGAADQWAAATPQEARVIEATLAAYPVLAAIHAAYGDRIAGHRRHCAALKPQACTCGEGSRP